MAAVGLGDLAHAFLLRRQSVALKGEAQGLAPALATGRAPDLAKAVAGDLVPVSALEGSLRRLDGFGAATAEAALFAQGMQAALARVDDIATTLAPTLLTAANTGHEAMVRTVGTEAAQAFDAAISALNTRLGDRTLFAGVETARPALAGSGTILAALEAAITGAGAQTAADVEAAVAGWFADPAGYGAMAYLGGAAMSSLPVSPEDAIRLDTTAADPAIRDTVEALALAALVDRGVLPLPEARADLARRAGEKLFHNSVDRADLAARIGTAEARIETARIRNGAETSALQIARAEILGVDGYETATRLEAAQSQIETLHAVTARLSRLSLVDFLR